MKSDRGQNRWTSTSNDWTIASSNHRVIGPLVESSNRTIGSWSKSLDEHIEWLNHYIIKPSYHWTVSRTIKSHHWTVTSNRLIGSSLQVIASNRHIGSCSESLRRIVTLNRSINKVIDRVQSWKKVLLIIWILFFSRPQNRSAEEGEW